MVFNGTSAQKGYWCQEPMNMAQRNLKITLKDEVRIRGFGKCVSAVYTYDETVKMIDVKL